MVDLHIHTTYSDGLSTPEDILKLTKKYSLFSICDHNNIFSSKTIHQSNFVNGVEVSILGDYFNMNSFEIHFLIYDYNSYDEKLNHLFDEFIFYNNLSFYNIFVQSIISNNIKIDFDIVKQVFRDYSDHTLTKVSLSKIMLDFNFGNNIYESYNQYIKPFCYPKIQYIDFQQLLDIIKDSGGYILLAHPFNYNFFSFELENFIRKLADIGIDGIELCLNYKNQCMNYIQKYGFLYSIGSDFHGFEFDRCNHLGVDDSIYLNDEKYIKNKLLCR